EPVCEHGLPVPRVEVALQALDGAAALQVPVDEVEPVELCAIGRVEDCEVALEVAGIEEPGLELAEHAQQLVGEPAESRRAREAVERRRGDEPADEERPLRVRDETGAVEVDEEVVERPDPTGEERGPAPEKLPRDGVDVRSRRHDEHRVAVERLDVAVEEKL